MLVINDRMHPDLKSALASIDLPEVQELIKRVSEFGLAVALPHRHGENGSFLPLKEDEVAFESELKVTFHKKDDHVLLDAVPVMWRWDHGIRSIGACAMCDFYQHPPVPPQD